MAPRTKKERIFRHMARDVPDYKIVYLSRDDLDDELGNIIFNEDVPFALEHFSEKYLGNWVRWIKIKHGEHAQYEIWSDYDISFNRYRLGGRLYPEGWRDGLIRAAEGSVSL